MMINPVYSRFQEGPMSKILAALIKDVQSSEFSYPGRA